MLCRLCLIDSENVLKIFDEDGVKLHIAEIVSQHFWFKPKQDDQVSNIICTRCWLKIDDFHQFYCNIQEAQTRFSSLSTYFKEDPIQVNTENPKSFIKEEENDEWMNDDVHPEYVDVIPSNEEVTVPESCDVSYKIENETKISEDECNEKENENDNDEIKNEDIKNLKKSDGNEKIKKTTPTTSCTSTVTLRKKRARGRPKKKLKNESDSDENLPLTHFIQKPKRNYSEWLQKSKADDEKIASYMKLKCEICFEEFITFAEIKQHYRKEHNKKGYVLCCNKKLYKRVLLLDHVNIHINPDYFKCTECCKTFADKQCLKNHMARHESDESKAFQCDKCPRKYAKKYLLDQHKYIHVPPEERQFICDDCGKAYGSYKLLRVHKGNAHNTRNKLKHVCEVCAKTFTNRTFFEKHQKEEHFGEKLPPEQCHLCKAWFKNKLTIRFHMKRHEDQNTGQTFECNICGKKAATRCAIKTHKQYAHGERKFKCNICDKAFKRAIVLKEHMTTHTGERLYKCEFCTKTFNSNANMHAHRKRAHPVEWAEDKKQKLFSRLPASTVTEIKKEKNLSDFTKISRYITRYDNDTVINRNRNTEIKRSPSISESVMPI